MKNIEQYRNMIYNTDCIAGMSMLPDYSVDMILCDLPYGITDCQWDSIIPFDLLWEQYNRVIKANGAIVLTAAQPFTTALIRSNQKDFRYCWYWVKNRKTGFAFAKYQPMRCVEDICVFYKKAPTYNPQGIIVHDAPILSRGKRVASGKDSVYRKGQRIPQGRKPGARHLSDGQQLSVAGSAFSVRIRAASNAKAGCSV